MTHEHRCLMCRDFYYCNKQHDLIRDPRSKNSNDMGGRLGYRCCTRCRARNIVACFRFRAYGEMTV